MRSNPRTLRRQLRSELALAVALSANFIVAPAAAGSIESLIVGGRARSYVIERPAVQGPRPTIFILHGLGGGIRQFGDLPQLALGVDAVSVIPQGVGGRWNLYPPATESEKYKQVMQQYGSVPDDVAFLKRLLADLVARGITDPRRTYVAGLSLGGAMALRMACTDAELFTAMALLITGMFDTAGAECRPAKPFPVLIVHGTADQVIPYGGGQTTGPEKVWPTEQLADFFRRLNGCTQAPVRSIAMQSPQRIEIDTSTCPGGAVVLYRIVGGGHEVPPALDAGRLMLDFFRAQNPRPSEATR